MELIDLQNSYDYSTLAPHFGVSPGILKNHLYGHHGYHVFPIPKKSGGVRLISSPNKLRRALQKKLLPVLSLTYRANYFAHGFIQNRSIKSNALPHVGKRTILNVDLQEFFSSITFKRVRGLFLKPPFSLQWSTANILAQLCCCDGVLPAGGITSPVISNLIMSKLDKRMASLTTRLGGDYTRYADDLTMSFDRPADQLSSLIIIDEVGGVSLGGALLEIISSEGFTANKEKIRISHSGSRKIVTGLVVNEKVNPQRKWRSSLESKIYAVEKFGWQHVAREDHADQKDPSVSVRMLMRRLHGKLSFYSMIRGKGDWICADLAHRFNALHDDSRLRLPSVEIISRQERAARGIFIIACYSNAAKSYVLTDHQGSGFCVSSGLIVTAAHVILDEDGNQLISHIYAMSERSNILHECDALVLDEHRDIAILKIRSQSIEPERHRFKINYSMDVGSNAVSAGYPDYRLGSHASIQQHQIIRKFVANGVHKAQITGVGQGGLSGAPLLDENMHVLGMLQKGNLSPSGIPEIIDANEIKRAAEENGITID